ncbi:hypothetical protein [sulfur-oxidizing endosymbiont of Gigantopelta aegis]|uniref:hypothetical protein n=1 Tax=sulfur-oxidizing endosymbiont of Gigantopelta aegis TaxID=2794934 RepID=UPI0018DDA98D|nr:hypothetical protein [sulfur-oxidizing endosymbiont of Gigantopelta aegis]
MSYVIDNLKDEETRTYTRILVLLMQNQIDLEQTGFFQALHRKQAYQQEKMTYGEPEHYTLGGIFYQLGTDLGKRLLKLSIKKEIRWFKLRFSAIKN